MADLSKLTIREIRRDPVDGWIAEVDGIGDVPLPWTSLATREQVLNDLVARPGITLAGRINAS